MGFSPSLTDSDWATWQWGIAGEEQSISEQTEGYKAARNKHQAAAAKRTPLSFLYYPGYRSVQWCYIHPR